LAASLSALAGFLFGALAALAAPAMSLQNAAARRLAVLDLTITVLTMTLTGIAADLRGRRATLPRRLAAVASSAVGLSLPSKE
jgi:Protein of unknown function (DUF1275)